MLQPALFRVPSSPLVRVLWVCGALGLALGAFTGQSPALGLPADHWLVGTSTAPDMYAPILAPDVPRRLLAEHGQAYLEQIGELRVLHLKGTPYEMGFQHGVLLRDEIAAAAKHVRMVGAAQWHKDFAASTREAWRRAGPHVPERFREELRGMAAGAGMTIEEIEDFNIFSELFHCSGFAVWGKATADGALLHGRVLDYMRDAGFDRWALVIVHEPTEGNAFINVGYAGMIGSVTGMNAKQVAIGEVGGGGVEQWDGCPMMLLVRDCLERGDTLEDVRRIMANTERTCQYFYVVSDAKADGGRGSAVAVAAEPGMIEFLGPNTPYARLPRPVEDAVLLSAGDRYTCLVDRVEKMWGKITPEIALGIMARGVAMQSNMHNVLFQPKDLVLWVANSNAEQPACNRPYVRLNMRQLLEAWPAP